MSDTKLLLNAEIEEARGELSRALASPTCVRSPRMGRLLEYLCEKTFAGLACEIKEYTIAVDLLGRPADFDPSENASARVEVHRLRKKLVEYYGTEAADRTVRIEIPPASYVPVFGLVCASLPLQLN